MCSNYMQLQIEDKGGACRAINQGFPYSVLGARFGHQV